MSRNNQGRKHGHYFKGVRHLTEIDVYRVCDLFRVDDPSGATQHAIKKLLLPGQRGGGKERVKDYREAVDTLLRRLEMLEEDAAAFEAIHLPPELLGEGGRTQPPLVDLPPALYSEADEQRMDIVGSNGNGGEHYAEASAADSGGDVGPVPEWVHAPAWAFILGRAVAGGSLAWIGSRYYSFCGSADRFNLGVSTNLRLDEFTIIEYRPEVG